MLVFHGCAGIYSVVEFEVLEPATVTLPSQVQRPIVLNRAPLTFDVFSEDNRYGLTEEQLLVVDTLIVKSLLRGLLFQLRQSPVKRFDDPLWATDRRRDTTLLEELILTRREVEDICAQNGGDAILSLESYSMELEVEEQDYEYEPYLIQNKYYILSNITRWNIYLPGHPRPFDTYTMVDTLFFSEYIDGKIQEFHRPAEMIREAFYKTGLKYGRYLVPVWVHTSRSLYAGREDSLKLASKKTKQGEWDSAYVIWEKLSVGTDSTLAAKAFNNMAVYHELEDNLEMAFQLVDKAMSLDTLEMVRAYKEDLEMRILNRKEVINQVD